MFIGLFNQWWEETYQPGRWIWNGGERQQPGNQWSTLVSPTHFLLTYPSQKCWLEEALRDTFWLEVRWGERRFKLAFVKTKKMTTVHIQNREGQVKMKVAAQFFFAFHYFSKSCLLSTPTAQVISGVRPSWCYVLVSSSTSSPTLIQRDLGSVIWIETNVTLLVDAGLVLFPLLSSFPRSPLFSLLPRFYYQRSIYTPTSSRKPPWHFETLKSQSPPLSELLILTPHQRRPYNSPAPGFLTCLISEEYRWHS